MVKLGNRRGGDRIRLTHLAVMLSGLRLHLGRGGGGGGWGGRRGKGREEGEWGVAELRLAAW